MLLALPRKLALSDPINAVRCMGKKADPRQKAMQPLSVGCYFAHCR
ncbi:hypothetical protein ABIE13_000878 [Ottowia thiooxydans]|uniref:Uncharacterized protein n=1 Tax=Ottowia thiooxydans TaxID=219182 RepID=A0ABV2Q4M7_9BURK